MSIEVHVNLGRHSLVVSVAGRWFFGYGTLGAATELDIGPLRIGWYNL